MPPLNKSRKKYTRNTRLLTIGKYTLNGRKQYRKEEIISLNSEEQWIIFHSSCNLHISSDSQQLFHHFIPTPRPFLAQRLNVAILYCKHFPIKEKIFFPVSDVFSSSVITFFYKACVGFCLKITVFCDGCVLFSTFPGRKLLEWFLG